MHRSWRFAGGQTGAAPAARVGRHGAASALVTLALTLAAAGCATHSGQITGVLGDTGGQHLVVYATDRFGPVGKFLLVLYDLDARGFRLTRGANVSAAPESHPDLSKNLLYIAFESDTGGRGNTDILIYSRALDALIPTPGLNTPDSNETEPAFTGDVQRMAFVREVNGHKRIRLYDATIKSLLQLPGLDTTATYNDWAPSPDVTGSRIAFVSDRNGNPDIFVYDRATRSVLDLPDLRSAGNDVEPSMTPDGRLLAFASDRACGAGGYDIYLYNLATHTFVPLTAGIIPNTAKDERNPSIGAGGELISFQSNRTDGFGKWDIWNYNRTTGQLGQGAQQSSTFDEIDPSIVWP